MTNNNIKKLLQWPEKKTSTNNQVTLNQSRKALSLLLLLLLLLLSLSLLLLLLLLLSLLLLRTSTRHHGQTFRLIIVVRVNPSVAMTRFTHNDFD